MEALEALEAGVQVITRALTGCGSRQFIHGLFVFLLIMAIVQLRQRIGIRTCVCVCTEYAEAAIFRGDIFANPNLGGLELADFTTLPTTCCRRKMNNTFKDDANRGQMVRNKSCIVI